MVSLIIKFKRISLLALLFLIPGCGMWDNFTTYFNLYYNTSELYEKAEEQILSQKQELFSTEPPAVPGNVNSDLVKVIEKCSNILQFNASSSYVDDALMMLGKSFYYQKNYQKAQRKFEELLSTLPESSYNLEAQLWVGKCRMRLKNYAEGLATLSQIRTKAIEEDEEKIFEESYIEEIVYRKTLEDYAGAINTANEFLNISSNDDIKAEIWYEVGNLSSEIDDTEAAIKAYQNVFEYSPDFELEVNTKLKLGKALREVGKGESALVIFEDMRGEDKFEEKFADIDLEIGKTLYTLGNYQEAIDQLVEVDTSYKNTPFSGAARFELASIYEVGLKQLDSAAIYYKKAVTSTLPPNYLPMVKDKDRIFTRYTSLRSDINKYNKHLYYLNNPDKFIQDSIAYVEDSLAIAKEIANVKELQEIWGGLDSLLNVSDTTGYFRDSLKVADTLVVRDSTGLLTRDSVFARIRQPERFDSLMALQFDSMFTNKTFDPEAMRKLEEQKRQNALLASQLTAQLPDTLKFKNNPPRRPSVSKDSLNTLLAKNQLDLGNLFLSELNLADSAYWYYDNSIKNYPATPYYATTLYAIGSYYLTINDKRRADSLFNIIYDNYKNESIVNAAADKLNKPFIDLKYDPAKIEYSEAENLLLSGLYSEAADAFFTIYEKYPESAFAPKALYTCGWIYENGIHDPVRSVAYYDTLITRYPSSVYVSTVAQKITVYKQDLRKRELALQDSINAVVTVDSLGADSLLVSEDVVSAEDTIEVAIEDGNEDQLAQEEKKIEEVTVHKTKEPVWNPRRRK